MSSINLGKGELSFDDIRYFLEEEMMKKNMKKNDSQQSFGKSPMGYMKNDLENDNNEMEFWIPILPLASSSSSSSSTNLEINLKQIGNLLISAKLSLLSTDENI